MTPAERPRYDRLIQDVRAATSAATFAAAWEHGAQMETTAAIELALGAAVAYVM